MRLPRDISGSQLSKRLEIFGYRQTRQTGSHLRLTTQTNGEHHITIPAHKPLRLGTLSSIINEVANHIELDRNEIIRKLFDK